MSEKPRNMLDSMSSPQAQEELLRELNKLSQKHKMLATTSLDTGFPYHVWTPLDFKNAHMGALVRENAKQGAVARTEALGPRNVELAEIYLKRLKTMRAAGNPMSESDLKALIGKNRYGLERSAAIAAIDDGLRRGRLNQK